MERSVPILHVEDDLVDVANLRRAFARWGVRNPLRVATNGEEALALLRGEVDSADAFRPGIILLDLSMPVMSGFEFLSAVKTDPEMRAIPIVILTASNQESDRRQAYQMGAAGYVVKSIDFASFVEAIGIIDRYWSLCEIP